jgi:SAM-dependent methyltransferase
VGVDREEHAGVRDRVDEFVVANLDEGIPDTVGDGYDVVLAADVFEHVREPARLLAAAGHRLAPGGSVIASVPNFGHWYPRTRVALGRFDYDRRGILDRDHIRFFTRRSFERMATGAGFGVRRREAVGLPLEIVDRGATGSAAATGGGMGRAVRSVDRFGVNTAPSLFAYQFLFELEPVASAQRGSRT